MTHATYTSNGTGATAGAVTILPRKKLPGNIANIGSAWTQAVRTVRAAVNAAVEHAPQRHSFDANRVADLVIDLVGELDHQSLTVLTVVLGVLIRNSRRHH